MPPRVIFHHIKFKNPKSAIWAEKKTALSTPGSRRSLDISIFIYLGPIWAQIGAPYLPVFLMRRDGYLTADPYRFDGMADPCRCNPASDPCGCHPIADPWRCHLVARRSLPQMYEK